MTHKQIIATLQKAYQYWIYTEYMNEDEIKAILEPLQTHITELNDLANEYANNASSFLIYGNSKDAAKYTRKADAIDRKQCKLIDLIDSVKYGRFISNYLINL